MPTPPEQPTTPETPAETPPAEVVAPNTPSEKEAPKEEAPAMSLEDALSEVEKTRGEAANYRIRAREAEQKLAEAKSLDEVNEIVQTMQAERETAERALLVENVALKYSLPEALSKRLVGTTREELEADAKALADIAVTEAPAPRLKGGLTPNEVGEESLSPGELARKHAPRR